MTSFPHASGLPQRQPASQSGSRRKDAFPPPPKSVRTWLVQAHGEDQPERTESLPALNQSQDRYPKVNMWGWILLSVAVFIGLAVWLFVSQLR